MQPLFSRLLKYAPTDGLTPLENFTTEALAGCIERDPPPFVSWLRETSLLAPDEVDPVVRVQTQVHLPSTGRLDLTVTLGDGNSTRQLWFEVKVYAGETGDQLTRYVQAAKAASRPTKVVVLARERLPSEADLIFCSWQSLRHILTRPGTSPLWTDFRHHLESIGMADRFDDRVSAGEAQVALNDAHGLYRKAGRILRLASEKLWDAGHQRLPKDGPVVLAQMAEQFQEYGRVMVHSAPRVYPQLFMGVYPAKDGPRWAVWVEVPPDNGSLRAQLTERFEAAGLAGDWQPGPGDYQVMCRTRPVSPAEDQAEVISFLRHSIEALSPILR